MKKLLLVVALVAAFCGKAHAIAGAGYQTFDIGISTPASTAILLASGPGNLVAVVISTGAAGDNCVFFDTASASNITADADASLVNGVHRIDLTVTATNTTTPLPAGSAFPFNNGIAIICRQNRRVHVLINQ